MYSCDGTSEFSDLFSVSHDPLETI